PGSTGWARRRGSSSDMPAPAPRSCPGSTRTARPSTSRTCRCGWCWSTGTAASTACGPRRRPRPGSTCTSWVSGAVAGPRAWPGAGIWDCRGPGAAGPQAGALTLPRPLPAPLSKPQIVGNSSVKAGGNTKLVCSVVHGKADAYWWKKNGQLLLGSERIQFVGNATLCILRASISDSGYYTCVVSNAVSQNETTFLLQVHRECPGARGDSPSQGVLPPCP
ncbi:HMCN1 protein, partial [Machaerirhynchus nigripectus]|nr:HMCN1 protein [Machaerirhynchus nigripectus]